MANHSENTFYNKAVLCSSICQTTGMQSGQHATSKTCRSGCSKTRTGTFTRVTDLQLPQCTSAYAPCSKSTQKQVKYFLGTSLLMSRKSKISLLSCSSEYMDPLDSGSWLPPGWVGHVSRLRSWGGSNARRHSLRRQGHHSSVVCRSHFFLPHLHSLPHGNVPLARTKQVALEPLHK